MGERSPQTKDVLQDIAVAAAADSRARRFAHFPPLSPLCSADGRTIAEARESESAVWNWHFPGKHSLAPSGRVSGGGRGSAADKLAGRSVAVAVAGVGEGGRVGLSLAWPAAAAWLSLPLCQRRHRETPFRRRKHTSRGHASSNADRVGFSVGMGAEVGVDGTNSLVKEGQRQ